MLQPFKIVDKKTGKTLTVYGDTAPTEQDQAELFDAYEKGTWRPGPPPKPFTITDEKNKVSLTVYGDEAPTEEEQKELFSAYRKGTWRPAPRPVYRTDQELATAVLNREAQGEASEDVKTFIMQAMKDRESERVRELKNLYAAQTSTPFGAMGLANMDPALRKEMMEAQAKPTPAAISEPPTSGQVGDIGMKVAVPLAVAMATRSPAAMAAAGAGVDMLVQKREEMRGEPMKTAPVRATRVLTEAALTAINPPALKAGTGIVGGIATRGLQTGAMVGAGELAQQVVGQATGQDVVDIQEVFDVATLGALFGGAFGALETTAPAIWSKIRGMKPSQALRALREMPETPATKEAITNLEQVVEQHLAPKPTAVDDVERAVGRPVEPAGQPARVSEEQAAELDRAVALSTKEIQGELAQRGPAMEEPIPSLAEKPTPKTVIDDVERIAGQPLEPVRRAEREAARAIGGEEEAKSFFEAMAAKRMVEGLEAPREVSLTEAIEGGLPPPAPTKAKASGLKGYAEASEAARAFEGLPPARRAEEAARVFEEAAAKAERAAAFSAKELDDQLTQNRLGTEEAIPLTEAQRLAKMEARGQELEKEALKARQRELKARPGEAAKEQGTITQRLGRMAEEEAQVEAAFKAGETPRRSSDEEVVMPTGEAPGPELSPQAQRMAERYGRANVGVLANLATGGGGFVVGWNTGEGLPPEERLARALAFGAGGAFTPTAIRRIIGMQKWADSVIKQRGVGSGSLNTADPQILAALSVKGAAMVGEGVKNFAEWGDKMVRQYGDSIRPKLKEIWAAGQEADIIPNKLVDKAPERPPKSLRSKGLVSPGKMAEAPERKVIRLGDRSKQRQEATDLLSEFAEKNKLTHMGAGLWAGEKAQLELKPGFGREWNLSFIGTRPEDRGKGYASNLLSRIVDFADKNGLPIKLVVEPTGEGKQRGLNAGQLISWYERKGFKLDEGSDNKMTRLPQAAPKMDPRIAGFITKQLAIPLGSFAGGFTYGFIDGKDLPADERLLRALQWAAVAGGVGYAAAKRSLKAINNERVPESTAKKLAPDALTGEEVLAKVRKTFTPEPTELTKEQKMLTTPVAKLVQSFQNVFRPLSEVEKNLIGRGDNLLLGDAASMLAGSVGKAEAALYPLQQAQKDLIPDVPKETLNDYLFLRRVIDRLTTDPETRQVAGYDIPQSRMGLDAIRKQLGDDTFVKLEQFARVVQTSADEDLKLMVRSGRMSQQSYDEIKAMNEFYAPFFVMEYFTQQDGALQGMGKTLDTAQTLTKAIKGIKDEDFKLVDIMSGFQINKMRAQVLADKNVIMRRMAELARLDTEHRFMKDLGSSIEAKYSGEMPKGWETVNYMENGVQKKLAVLPEVAEAVKGMDSIRAGAFMTTLGSFASPLRAGATALNLGFQVVNVIKDSARLGIMSKYGIEKNPVDFFTFVGDLFVGAIHSWRSNLLGNKSQLYLDYLKSGAARSTLSANLTPDALTRAMQQGDDQLAANILKVPLRSFIRGTEKMGNALEESIKLAGFRRGVRAEGLGKLSGKAYDDALERIAYEVRNYAGSPDFSKHGTHGRALNVLFMFANARIQGSAADLRRLIGQTGTKERNQAAVRLAAGVGSATTYLWYLNNQPENVEDYNKRSLSERNAYFLWPRYTETGDPMYYINEEGQKIREYYRFPKFEVVGMMANVLESALNYTAKKDPKGIIETGKVALENLSPIPITGRNFLERVQSVASGLNPVFKAPLELATNTSFYQHRDIVKQRLQGVRPEEQYLETTPKAFIDVAQAMPESAPDFLRSPLYLKNLTENFTGSLLTQFMRPQLEGRSSATTNPLVARFFSSPIVDEQETWDEINKYKTEQSTASLLRERAINEYLKNADSYTPAQRMQSLAQILASDPENNAVAMYNALRDRTVGVTDVDRAVRSLRPPFRAEFIENRAQKMTPQERDAFYLEMVKKGLINKETAEAIIQMRAAPAGKKTSFKEGRLYKDPTTGVVKIYRNGAFV